DRYFSVLRIVVEDMRVASFDCNFSMTIHGEVRTPPAIGPGARVAAYDIGHVACLNPVSCLINRDRHGCRADRNGGRPGVSTSKSNNARVLPVAFFRCEK